MAIPLDFWVVQGEDGPVTARGCFEDPTNDLDVLLRHRPRSIAAGGEGHKCPTASSDDRRLAPRARTEYGT